MKKKTETKSQAIVDIAAEVFREMGFERASMSPARRRFEGDHLQLLSFERAPILRGDAPGERV
jgi:hypothetical protein